MHLETRKAGNKKKYYLAHSYRKGGKVRKVRIYLGSNLSAQELEAKKKQAQAKLAQRAGVVVHARRRHDADGVELLRRRKPVGDLGKTRDDAAPVADDARGAALPVAGLGLVRVLELAEQVHHHVLLLRQALEPGDEARPRTALELIQHGGWVRLLGHKPVLRQSGKVAAGHRVRPWAAMISASSRRVFDLGQVRRRGANGDMPGYP